MTAPLDLPGLAERLQQEAECHKRRVHETLLALRTRDLDGPSALDACGRELHSLKGAASLLGMLDIFGVIGKLGEHMMRHPREPGELFWSSFEAWFGLVVHAVNANCRSARKVDTAKLGKMREDLERSLGCTPQVIGFERPQPPSRGDSFTPSAGRRLLIIEDSATVRAALSARLGQRGYPVECAEDLLSVASKLREFDPEIVICDVHMPGVEGDEICRRLKSHMRRLVPVILYSSLDLLELEQRALRARADGFVSKSQGIDALVQRMDELLGEEILF